jgi:hypothetical protein
MLLSMHESLKDSHPAQCLPLTLIHCTSVLQFMGIVEETGDDVHKVKR